MAGERFRIEPRGLAPKPLTETILRLPWTYIPPSDRGITDSSSPAGGARGAVSGDRDGRAGWRRVRRWRRQGCECVAGNGSGEGARGRQVGAQ